MSSKKKAPKNKNKFIKLILNQRFGLFIRLFSTAIITISIMLIFLYGINMIEKKITKENDTINISKEEFISNMIPFAKINYENYGILPSITIAQSILESNWGKSELSQKYNNYFGIKSFKESENRVQMQTSEYYNSKMNNTVDFFRTYNNLEESVNHHGLLLGTAPRYKNVLLAKNYKEASLELYKASYSTDPNYPEKINSIIETYRLDLYDPK